VLIDGEHLYPAPKNGLRPAPPRDLKRHPRKAFAPCIVHLVWTGGVEQILPGEIMWVGKDRVQVRWPSRPGGDFDRITWLPKRDVRTSWKYRA